MRQITAAAPGMVDFFAMLEVLRTRHKPQEKVLEITATYTQSAITPRTMTAAADGHMEAVRTCSMQSSSTVLLTCADFSDLG